jgi:hypothetical protein
MVKEGYIEICVFWGFVGINADSETTTELFCILGIIYVSGAD